MVPDEDELAKLRKEALELAEQREKEVEKERLKEKKDKKSKRKRSSSGSGRNKLRTKAKKKLDDLFADTGLDPEARNRKRFLRKAQKKVKKRKRGRASRASKSSSSSGSSHGSVDQSVVGLGKTRLFSEDSVPQELAEDLPGTLAAQWLLSAKDHLLLSRGDQDEEEPGKLPLVATRYVRQALHDRMAPPMRRELLNISRALDRLLAGRPAECADVLVQRLKSLEMVSQGVHYSIANKVDLIEDEKVLAASATETLDAAKRASAEEKLLQKTQWKGGQRPGKERSLRGRAVTREAKAMDAKGSRRRQRVDESS